MLPYKQFTLEDRVCLQALVEGEYGIRQIARILLCSPSSISREIKRNQSEAGYNAWYAHCQAQGRTKRSAPLVIREGSEQWKYIIDKLHCYWSPETIAMRWRKEHPDSKFGVMTVYRYIYRGLFPTITAKQNLRRRGKRKVSRDLNCNTIKPDRTIPQWPDEIKERLRFGDWEGDTIYGSPGKGLAVSLVDRRSRYLLLAPLKSRNAQLTRQVMVEMLRGQPVQSISLDNGSEFAEFHQLEEEVKTEIYFAEPHKPWQRGLNENTNGIIRFFFPKGSDFNSLPPDALSFAADLINRRPRKCLGWRSPHEVFFGVALLW